MGMNEDQANFANTDDVEIDLDAIRAAIKPLLWRVLICPVQPRKLSKGGIALPESAQDAETHLNYIGRVVAVGPLAGKSEKFENPAMSAPLGMKALYEGMMEGYDWPTMEQKHPGGMNDAPRYLWSVKEGDIVVYGRFAGQRMEWHGVRLLMANDDEILGVVDSLEGFRIYAA